LDEKTLEATIRRVRVSGTGAMATYCGVETERYRVTIEYKVVPYGEETTAFVVVKEKSMARVARAPLVKCSYNPIVWSFLFGKIDVRETMIRISSRKGMRAEAWVKDCPQGPFEIDLRELFREQGSIRQ
jgi:hypothetical protein